MRKKYLYHVYIDDEFCVHRYTFISNTGNECIQTLADAIASGTKLRLFNPARRPSTIEAAKTTHNTRSPKRAKPRIGRA